MLTKREKYIAKQSFIAGCRYGHIVINSPTKSEAIKENEQRLAEEAPDNWISTKDKNKLPCCGAPVIIFAYGYVQDATYVFDPDNNWWTEAYEELNRILMLDVTHWQPLPETPKGKGLW